MPEPYLGEIVAVGFYFDASGFSNAWLPCDGRILAIQQNAALFSLIGTYYGGDGTRTFALPNLNTRVAASQGQGPGLTPRGLGEQVGISEVTLTRDQLPAHAHKMRLGQTTATDQTPGPGTPGTTAAINPVFNGFVTPPTNVQFATTAIYPDGGQQPHPNDQPNTSLWYLICVSGIFPSFD